MHRALGRLRRRGQVHRQSDDVATAGAAAGIGEAKPVGELGRDHVAENFLQLGIAKSGLPGGDVLGGVVRTAHPVLGSRIVGRVRHHRDERLDRCNVPADAGERATERQAQFVPVSLGRPVADQQCGRGDAVAVGHQFGAVERSRQPRVVTSVPGNRRCSR